MSAIVPRVNYRSSDPEPLSRGGLAGGKYHGRTKDGAGSKDGWDTRRFAADGPHAGDVLSGACALIGGIAPIAAASHRDASVPQRAGPATSAALDVQHATYRYTGRPDGTTQMQRSLDGGCTWTRAGIVPESVSQLAASPADDTVVSLGPAQTYGIVRTVVRAGQH